MRCGTLQGRILIAKHKTHIQNQMRLKKYLGLATLVMLWLVSYDLYMTNNESSSVFCFFKPINSFDRHTKLDSLNVLTPSEI